MNKNNWIFSLIVLLLCLNLAGCGAIQSMKINEQNELNNEESMNKESNEEDTYTIDYSDTRFVVEGIDEYRVPDSEIADNACRMDVRDTYFSAAEGIIHITGEQINDDFILDSALAVDSDGEWIIKIRAVAVSSDANLQSTGLITYDYLNPDNIELNLNVIDHQNRTYSITTYSLEKVNENDDVNYVASLIK